jgi:hypothetical protein
MIERLRRPFGCDFLSDTATSYLEVTVPFARIFTRNNATKHTRSQCHSQRQANVDLFDETHRQRAQILEEL